MAHKHLVKMKAFFLMIINLCFMAMVSNGQSTSVKSKSLNVLGSDLESCCNDPLTGYFRDGYCHTNMRDFGTHVVCAVMTDEFLKYSATCGNDLITPQPQFTFPGLKAGDKWCLCISRWLEAEKAGVAPKLFLKSTEVSALRYTTIEKLKEYALDE